MKTHCCQKDENGTLYVADLEFGDTYIHSDRSKHIFVDNCGKNQKSCIDCSMYNEPLCVQFPCNTGIFQLIK